jgi:hypothetical protein
MDRELRDALGALTGATDQLRHMLAAFVRHTSASVEGLVFEDHTGTIPITGVQQTDYFVGQTAGLELIEGILVITPLGTTQALLQVGGQWGGAQTVPGGVGTAGKRIPVQNTTFLLSPICWKSNEEPRILTYTWVTADAPAGYNVIPSYMAFWGRAAPQLNPPGVLGH